jgi:hypothetical protein
MLRCLLTAGILCLLLPAAVAAEPPSELLFRLDVGLDESTVIDGKMLRNGDSWDRAVLDLDGDGAFEKEFVFRAETRSGRTWTPRRLDFEHGGAQWMVDLTYTRFPTGEGGGRANIRWSVTKGDFYAWFINGPLFLAPKPELAKAQAALRMGPPFELKPGSMTRGMQHFVRVGLKDANGCTLRLARAGKAQRKIHIRLLRGEEEVLAEWATYG